MNFTLSKSIEIIERTPIVFSTMLSGLSEEWIHGNEGENTWNAKEVLAHLISCEISNWLPRVRIILSNNSDKTLVRLDLTTHFEIAKNNSLDELLTEFKTHRENSIKELKGFNLKNTDYKKTAFHPHIFEVNLQQLIATWVTHDLSHIAQVSRILAQQYKKEVGPFKEYLKILK